MKTASFTFKVGGSTPKDPLSIYHLGQGFFLAGKRCLLEIAVGPGAMQCLVSPGVANLCFAIELFMKSLIILGGQDSPRTHKLADLGNLLDRSDLEAVKAYYDVRVQDPSFDNLLIEVSEFFVKLRYEYEFDLFSLNDHPVSVLAEGFYLSCADRNKRTSPVPGLRP